MPIPKSPYVIEVDHLCVDRGQKILNDINWKVKQGEHWFILGANGSGKTTLVNILTAYTWPTEGRVCVLGQTYGKSDWRELRKSVGLVSAGISQKIEETETVLNIISSGKEAQINLWGKVSKPHLARAKKILKQVELNGLDERPWRFLSQGERQRALIGRALMTSLKLLILDEPCAGLDPVSREQFLGFIERLSKTKRPPSVIFITHHVEEIIPVFSHGLLLKSGRIFASGAKKMVLTSQNISRLYQATAHIRRNAGRYSLKIHADARSVV